MYFFLKYIVTLFYKKLRIKIVVCLLCESGPRDIYQLLSSLCCALVTQYTTPPPLIIISVGSSPFIYYTFMTNVSFTNTLHTSLSVSISLDRAPLPAVDAFSDPLLRQQFLSLWYCMAVVCYSCLQQLGKCSVIKLGNSCSMIAPNENPALLSTLGSIFFGSIFFPTICPSTNLLSFSNTFNKQHMFTE